MDTAAQAISNIVGMQHALTVVNTMGIFAFINARDGWVANCTSFDFIVVGGGTSGAVVANRLSKNGYYSVLLVDAGGNFPLESAIAGNFLYNGRSNHDWNYTTVNDGHTMQCHPGGVFLPILGKVLGGTSAMDFMLYSQGDAHDYDQWADITNEPSWKFENVQRLFKKVERFNDDKLYRSKDAAYHGFHGSIGLTKEARPLDHYLNAFKDVGKCVVPDINYGNRLGYTRAIYYIDDRLRQSSAVGYLTPARDRKNLVVIKNTQVIKILFENKKAVGIVAVSSKNKTTLVFKAKREVIVAAGTFNTAKLLQLSGIGPEKLLKQHDIKCVANLPVGKNYQNHVATTLVYKTKKTSQPFIPENFDNHKFPSPVFYGYVALNKTQKYPDYLTVNFAVSVTPARIIMQYNSFLYRFQLDMCEALFRLTTGREFVYTLLEDLKPKSTGTVEICSKDPFIAPVIKTGYYSHKDDFKNMLKYVKDFVKIGESPYYKQVGAALIDPMNGRCGEFNPKSDTYWKCYILCMMSPRNHHSGTAAMGKVVDGRLRVIGVEGLRVADASVMPTPVSGESTIPTAMIGENAGEMILEDYQRKRYCHCI